MYDHYLRSATYTGGSAPPSARSMNAALAAV
jgi:hypothetical protein